MPTSTFDAELRRDARASGFDVVAVTRPDAIPQTAQRLRAFLEAGWHGDMGWMKTNEARRASPGALWSEVRSIVVLAMNYGPGEDPLAALERKDRGTISVYARNRDYHDVVKGRLKQIAGRFAARTGADVKVFVDTAPVMEKPLAEAAGIGWQGKHTNLVSRQFGSWLFLGAIFTDAELEADAPERDYCGSCRACLDICPTHAFPAPYQLDARRCISYLTIEHKGHIAEEFRAAMGNRIYGCDDCLAVCPWNKFAKAAREAKFHAREELRAPRLAELAGLDEATFRKMFAGSPIKRVGRARFVRNVLIAIGNSGEAGLAPAAERRLADPSPLVRAMAVWALGRLLDPEAFAALRVQILPEEGDEGVRSEWIQSEARSTRPASPPHPTLSPSGGEGCEGLASAKREPYLKLGEGLTRRKRGSSPMAHLFCFGLGYSARALAEKLLDQGWSVSGTVRGAGKSGPGDKRIEVLLFDGAAPSEEVRAALQRASHILVSAPPGEAGDPVLACHGGDIAAEAGHLKWIGYLSTVGVYGDHAGHWVDEETEPKPVTARGLRRLTAERAWAELGAGANIPVAIFRLAGIYGPGRSPLDRLARGKARRIVKGGQVFNRIHVADITTVLAASIARPPSAPRVYNVCDDQPAPPQDVIAFAAHLLGVPPPPEERFETAQMSEMARSFYADNKSCRNDRIKRELGVTLAYPDYRAGLTALHDSGAAGENG